MGKVLFFCPGSDSDEPSLSLLFSPKVTQVIMVTAIEKSRKIPSATNPILQILEFTAPAIVASLEKQPW